MLSPTDLQHDAATLDEAALPNNTRASWPTGIREAAILLSVWLGYRAVRAATRYDDGGAFTNAARIVSIESHLGIATERTVQRWALGVPAVIDILNRYYVSVHFPATIAFLLWVFFRQRHVYTAVRTWFVSVTAAALAVHIAFPLAPPRMLAGFVDTLREYGPNIYPTDPGRSLANQFAAMPSLHFGWALMVAVTIIAISRSRWRWLAALHPAVTLVAIVATANHYWLDALVAAALALPLGVLINHRIQQEPS